MSKVSAGILMFRRGAPGIEVLLAHPGGPFWMKKDAHAWSIPKGEFDPSTEDAATAALRELTEETGARAAAPLLPLRPVKQPGGKTIHAFAVEQDFDVNSFHSNTFSLEWPPRSGLKRDFPEVDRVAWFSLDEAVEKMLPGQLPLLQELATRAGATVTV